MSKASQVMSYDLYVFSLKSFNYSVVLLHVRAKSVHEEYCCQRLLTIVNVRESSSVNMCSILSLYVKKVRLHFRDCG